MTTIKLTRTLNGYHAGSLEALLDDLTRKLHTQVKPAFVEKNGDDLTILCTVVAPEDTVRLACAAMVHEPVRWDVER